MTVLPHSMLFIFKSVCIRYGCHSITALWSRQECVLKLRQRLHASWLVWNSDLAQLYRSV